MNALSPKAELGFHDPCPEIATEPAGDCVVCGGDAFQVIARGSDFELRTCSNEWEFQECHGCGHVQLDPRPAPETLPTIYPRHYYSYDMKQSVGRLALAGKAWLDRKKFRSILRFLGRLPEGYLDIGCGDLKYLEMMRGMGVPQSRLFGLELDEAVAEAARRRGFQVFAERAETATSIPRGQVDFVTMFHVIEHVADPNAVIARIANLLPSGGVLALETPNFDSLDARLFRSKYWGGYHIPRHWHLFTRSGLARLLERNGFTVADVTYQTGHSFWLYSLHHLIRYNAIMPMPRVAKLFDPLRSLPMLVLVTAFDTIRAKLGCRTSAMLLVARRN